MMNNNQITFLGLMLDSRQQSAAAVNRVLSEFGEIIINRMGMPYANKKCWLISLVLDASTEQTQMLVQAFQRMAGVQVFIGQSSMQMA